MAAQGLLDFSPIWGVIINAMVSALAIFVTYIVAKQNRWNTGVTQFRQQWINNLRDAISLFIAKAELISMLDLDDNAYYAHFEELSQMNSKIELLLNPTEDDHNELVDKMGEIRELIHSEITEDFEEFEDMVENNVQELLEISKRVLKKEWNVVKQGK